MALTEAQKEKEFERRSTEFQKYLQSPEYRELIIQRLQLQDAGTKSAESRAYIHYLCQRPDNPAEGCIFFIENFGWSFDPRPEHAPHHLPFVMFDYQKEAVRWLVEHIDNGKDGLIEKSRDMGASWLFFIWVPLWYWLFRDGVNILIGSYKESLVDDRTNDSLFGKIDYSLRSLPTWMLPKKFNPEKHRTKLKLVNPENYNQITGDTMNPAFGRGSRKTAVFFDELGFWDYAKDAWESSGDSTSCRVANSTPHGRNYYSILRDSGIDVVRLHWSEHPLKDQAWYDFECARRTPEEVAQELDISYDKSREGRVYEEWFDYTTKGIFEYDPTLPLYVAWDFGRTDDTAIIWAQPNSRGGINIIDTYRNTGKNIDFYVPFVTGITPSEGYKYKKEDLDIIQEHKEWRRGTHFGDPSGRFQNQVVDQSVIDKLKEYGIIVNFAERWKYHSTRKSATKRMIMDGINLNDRGERTKYFDSCINNASYPKVKVEGIDVFNTMKPKHDSTSHYRSALEYLALGLEDYRPRMNMPYDKFKKKEEIVGRRQVRRSVGY